MYNKRYCTYVAPTTASPKVSSVLHFHTSHFQDNADFRIFILTPIFKTFKVPKNWNCWEIDKNFIFPCDYLIYYKVWLKPA